MHGGTTELRCLWIIWPNERKQNDAYNLEKPRRVLHVKEVAFPIVTESVLHQLNQLSAVTFMPVPNLKQLIKIA